MVFNSIPFLIFFLFTILIYYIVNRKYQNIILLISSYIFYIYAGINNILILLFVTLISYFSGLLIEKQNNSKTKKKIVGLTIILILGTLVYFKYLGFILQNINFIFNGHFVIENIIVPLGISFFTLQAISYPIDVYRKDITVEKNILNFALFISFFPQILSGPIGKSKEMLPQFREKHIFNYKEIKKGFVIVLFGLFKKIVLADLLAIGVNNVYDNLHNFVGFPLLIIVLMYSLQIYFDFSSYSNISYGIGKMLGFELNKNFDFPYFASNIKTFWRRWHMSLTSWFTEYVYIPLGGNRKGLFRTYINIIIIFVVSGLWHGAAWIYIIWGLLHSFYQIIETKLKLKSKILGIILNFLLVSFAWIFFRSSSISDALYIITNVFNLTFLNIKEQILSIGLDKYDLLVSFISCLTILIIELLYYKKKFDLDKIINLPYIVQLLGFLIVIFSIIIFGTYGPGFDNSQFIYLGY